MTNYDHSSDRDLVTDSESLLYEVEYELDFWYWSTVRASRLSDWILVFLSMVYTHPLCVQKESPILVTNRFSN